MKEKHFEVGKTVMFRYANGAYKPAMIRGVNDKEKQYLIEIVNDHDEIIRAPVDADRLFSAEDMDKILVDAEELFNNIVGSFHEDCVMLLKEHISQETEYSPAFILSVEYDDFDANCDKFTILHCNKYSEQILIEKIKVQRTDLTYATEPERLSNKEAFDVLKTVASMERKLF